MPFPEIQTDLEGIFDDRLSTDLTTRKRESIDWGAQYLSPAFQGLVEKCVADAVVWPVNVDEVVDLLKFAKKHKIPVVPRGAGTGNVGGVLPLRGGIIVDMTMMNKVLAVEEVKNTAWVESGARFLPAMKTIRAHNVEFRVYPTSYAISTVGGFVAGGSRGIGSYEYGLIWDNIEALEMVLPGGDVMILEGDRVDLGSHAFGTTGIITKVNATLKPQRGEVVKIATFENVGTLARAASTIVAKRLPLWHVQARSPGLSKLVLQLLGLGGSSWTLNLAYSVERDLDSLLSQIVKESGGQIMDEVITDPESRDRFLSGIFGFPTTPPIVQRMRLQHPNEYFIHVVRYFPTSQVWDKVNLISGSPLSSLMEINYYKVRRTTLGHITIYADGGSETLEAMNELIHQPGAIRFDLHSFCINDRLGVLAPDKLSEIIGFKRQVDADELMNPGKLRL